MNKFLEDKLNNRISVLPELKKHLISFFSKLDEKNILTEEQLSNFTKTAYPQATREFIQTPYDTYKWTKSLQEIYSFMQVNNSGNFYDAFNKITYGWDEMEKQDFKNWISYYQQETQNKYKTAQYYPSNFKADPNQTLKANILPTKDQSASQTEPSENEKKQLVTKKIQSIISRLQAAEKIATDPEIRHILSSILDINLEDWLARLHQVKRMIQAAPLKNVYSSLIEDIIIREANKLVHSGFKKAARELVFLAQDAINSTPTLPSAQSDQNVEDPLEEFMKSMNFEDNSKTEDHIVVEDQNDIVDPDPDDMANIHVLAQETLPPQQINKQVQISQPDQEVPEEPESKGVAKTKIHEKTDGLFEQALSNITVDDAIARLEVLANLFRTREVSRQLAIIDIMFDKLNISAFFPSLAEAHSKQLESNQYCLTRIEEILSKLRGAVKTPENMELDLVGKPIVPTLPEIQKELANQMSLERQLKEKRRRETQEAELSEPLASEQTQAEQPSKPQSPVNELSVPATAGQPQPTVKPVQ